MRKILREEKVITKLGDEIKITLAEDIDDLTIELGIDIKVYVVKVQGKDFDLYDSSKCYSTETNARKYFEKILSKFKNNC